MYAVSRPGLEFFPEVDLVLGPDKVYSPDVVVYAPGRIATIPIRLDLPPDLIVEVLSPGTKAFDLTTKRDDYEAFGVGEYWAADPADARVRVYRRSGGRLLESAHEATGVEAHSLAGFTLDFSAVRRALGR
jgi:Uma2 family endonuclease